MVGMLLYLATCTRPDIAYAVSQVARFSSSPKQSHVSAIKTIIRYLKRTIDQGIIMRPDGTVNLDAYVDADFAGLHRHEKDYDPTSSKSRTGYFLFLGNCPLYYKSSLQTEISLSTLEAEYSALSACTCTVIFTRNLLQETIEALNLPSHDVTNVECTVWEDNNGALLLATNQKITKRTKYFHMKWHHFWSKVKTHENPKGFLNVIKVSTQEQRADYLRKGLPKQTFERVRLLSQGWQYHQPSRIRNLFCQSLMAAEKKHHAQTHVKTLYLHAFAVQPLQTKRNVLMVHIPKYLHVFAVQPSLHIMNEEKCAYDLYTTQIIT